MEANFFLSVTANPDKSFVQFSTVTISSMSLIAGAQFLTTYLPTLPVLLAENTGYHKNNTET